MRIAVLGGAMGSLYGRYLSRKHEVVIVDVNTTLVEKINSAGLVIAEPDGSSAVYHPKAVVNTAGMLMPDCSFLIIFNII